MTINAGPEYFAAEKKYLAAKSIGEKIAFLEEMIRKAPKHKSSENFVANLKQRLGKLVEKQERAEKTRRSSGKRGIKKEGFQIALLGFTKGGKSSLLSKLTNAHPDISANPFTTSFPIIGTFNFEGIKAQLIDLPSIGSEFFDIGIINTADLVLIVIENLSQLDQILPLLYRIQGKQLITINKTDLLSSEELRKLNEKIRSKKINAIPISTYTDEGIPQLKDAIFRSMNVIRVYTKEPGKPHSPLPVTLPINSTVKDVAESIRKGFFITVKETRLTGPSSKFPNQKVGLSHIVKDKDIVEFHTK